MTGNRSPQARVRRSPPRAARRWLARRLEAARGAAWTLLALARARHRLQKAGLAARIEPPPWTSDGGGAGVRYVLARSDATCLERALVMQSWLVACGHRPDIVIGVSAGESPFAAHAWIEDYDDADGYREIHRLSP